MLFAFPYALLGLTVVAGLVAVYTFRARFRRRPVSSLMLWSQTQRPRQGGTHRDRLRLPPLFYIELIALTLLVLAAIGPYIRRPDSGTLTVVFDASASMSARDDTGQTPQARAARALQAAVRHVHYARVRLLAARAGRPETSDFIPPSQAVARLLQTPCQDPADSLTATLALAGELSDPADDILVLTDRAPEIAATLRPGIRWLALGISQPNLAITLAARTWVGHEREVLLIEVTGFGYGAGEIPLRVAPLAGGATLFDGRMALDSEGHGRLRLELPPGTATLVVEIPPDALDIDNRAVLVPDPPRQLAVAVDLGNPALRRIVERALTATGRVVWEAAVPHIVFTDHLPGSGQRDGLWQMVITRPEAPRLVRGPYLADGAHSLLEGVSFEGLTWPVGSNSLPGRILLFADNAPLLSIDAPSRGPTTLHLVSAGANDALYRSAAWPALIWNLLQACAETQPGPTARNLRAGATARFATARQTPDVRFETPSGEVRLSARAGRVDWAPIQSGYYRMWLDDKHSEPFAVNFQSAAESDLRQRHRGEWGEAADAARLHRTHRSVAWLAALAALLLIGVHHGILGVFSQRRQKDHESRGPA